MRRIEDVHERDGSWWPAIEVRGLASDVQITQDGKTIVLHPSQAHALIRELALAIDEGATLRGRAVAERREGGTK